MAGGGSSSSSSRLHSLSRIFSTPSPIRKTPKIPDPTPKPQPIRNPNPSPNSPKNLRTTLNRIFRERNPDKLVAEFISASASSPRFRQHHRVYEVAVSRLAAAGRPDAVAAVLDAQKPFLPSSGDGFAARLISLYGRAAMLSHAAAAFRDLPSPHRSPMAFNALLTAYADAGEHGTLAAAFQEIPQSDPSIAPNVYTYNILIHALCQKTDLSAALDVITLMEKCGIAPNVVSFNTLLNGFYNDGRIDEAEEVWELMKEKNVAPNARSYNAKLRWLIAEGRIEDAVRVVLKMERDGPKPDTVSYNELIQGYCKDGRLEEAKRVYEDLVKNECAPNKRTFETLVPPLLEAGELDLALSCCHESISPKCRVDCSVLQGVVDALVEASRVEEARRVVELGRKNYYSRKELDMPQKSGEDKEDCGTQGEELSSEEERENA